MGVFPGTGKGGAWGVLAWVSARCVDGSGDGVRMGHGGGVRIWAGPWSPVRGCKSTYKSVNLQTFMYKSVCERVPVEVCGVGP